MNEQLPADLEARICEVADDMLADLRVVSAPGLLRISEADKATRPAYDILTPKGEYFIQYLLTRTGQIERRSPPSPGSNHKDIKAYYVRTDASGLAKIVERVSMELQREHEESIPILCGEEIELYLAEWNKRS
jgi:hypothetical protein